MDRYVTRDFDSEEIWLWEGKPWNDNGRFEPVDSPNITERSQPVQSLHIDFEVSFLFRFDLLDPGKCALLKSRDVIRRGQTITASTVLELQ